jgi:hypothetical protein
MESFRYLSSGLAALSAALAAVALSAPPVLAAGLVLTPSPQTVQAGETIDLSVTDFQPCAPQSPAVLWDKIPQSYTLVAGSLTASDFTVGFVVPSGPAGSVGSHLIIAACPSGNGYAPQQRAVVQVVPATPVLAASPQSVLAGGTVTMTGSGFTPCTSPAGSTTVELSGNGTPLAQATVSNGAFQQAITVPSGTPVGPYSVTTQCPDLPGSDLASTNVDVVTLTLSSSSVNPGTTISVDGAGYTQCNEVQVQLLRDATQTVAMSGPLASPNGSFSTEMTVPSSAVPGTDYEVDAGCYPAAGTSAAIAVDLFTVTAPASASASLSPSSTSASPASQSPSSTSASPASQSPSSASASPASQSPNPTQGSPASPSPTLSGTTSPSSPGSSSRPPSRPAGVLWAPVALVGGTGAGLAIAALFLVRVLSMVHWKRGRWWVNRHLRVVAGSAGPLSADVERRPGAVSVSVSVGLEPHLDHLGHQQYEEVTAR